MPLFVCNFQNVTGTVVFLRQKTFHCCISVASVEILPVEERGTKLVLCPFFIFILLPVPPCVDVWVGVCVGLCV